MTEDSTSRSQPVPDVKAPDEAALKELLALERSALAARRLLALDRPDGETGEIDSRLSLPRVGLAISGGGVRSATFGLGLLRGLAKNGLLSRIDYLSTVSGGGFVGAMFGRLVAELGIKQAQEMLAHSTSPVLDWLRRNGRYLTPAGARDLGIAFVTYLRAIIAIHGESLIACLPLLLVVIVPHLLQQGFEGFDLSGWKDWHSLWWPLALGVWLIFAPGLMVGFWVARDTADPSLVHAPIPLGELAFIALFGLVTVIASATAAHNLTAAAIRNGQTYALLVIGVNVSLWSCLAGLAGTPFYLRASQKKRALAVAGLRNYLTRALRWVTRAAAVMALLGALDLASWRLLEAMESGEDWVWGSIGVGGAGLILMRSLAQPLQQLAEQAKAGASANWGPRLLNLAGIAGLVLLLLGWLALVQWLVFTPVPLLALSDFSSGVRALGLLFIGCLWWAISARNEQMANASSLHGFYRARLTRAYLAVANPKRSILASAGAPAKTDVTEVVPGDDLDLREYHPEAKGGPIHLVNACLNQTRDDASHLYNADRKGTLVTASARAFEIGPRDAAILTAGSPDSDVGTLGRWVAVSGAAASPGAGSYTSAGWAALLFFLGVRLGYWTRAPKPPAGGWKAHVLRNWRFAVKPLMLWGEFSATFFGAARPWWYLSDGGHFDNTAVYALLKRRLDFIILADGSADGEYRFSDIENLVRKARIDFGAEIEFYTATEAAKRFPPMADDQLSLLSPESLANNHSARGVLMARVTYSPDADGKRPEATLLIVKPNLHDALDLDLLAYAQRHPTFPHEPTSDQSFDEAQWESYHRLGEDFGHALQPAWLARLPGWTMRFAHPAVVAARLRTASALSADAKEPLWRRTARATAIGATIGLSASGTVLLGVWQVIEHFRQADAADQKEAQRVFIDVSKDLQNLDGACPKVAEHTVAQLGELRNLREGTRLRPLEVEGVGLLVDHVLMECEKPPAMTKECLEAAERATNGLCAQARKPLAKGTALTYWGDAMQAPVTVASLLGYLPAKTQVASVAPAPVPPADSAAPPSATPPTVTRGGEAPAPASAPQGAPLPPPPGPVEPASAPAPTLAKRCADHGPVQLYAQVYDEASRETATALMRLLQQKGDGSVRVAPVENVVRSAELRQQRRPVPWPQPTLVVHDPANTACAKALSEAIRSALPVQAGRDNAVWVRPLPRSLKPQSGVIELWIPPKETGMAAGG